MQPPDQDEFANKTAYVIVLGDMGRSPRMRNHAVAMANVGFQVTLVGYAGSQLTQSVRSRIKVSALAPYPQWMARWLPWFVSLPFKTIWQFITLLFALPIFTWPWSGPDLILMQNPPSIPTLVVSYVYAFIHPGTKRVLDWHNYGFSILQLSFGDYHWLVRLARCIEAFFGPRVHAAFCVSKAMKRDLHSKWNIDATVLYDRPLDTFRPCSIQEKHQVMTRLALEYNVLAELTEIGSDGVVRDKPNRPAILVSSTSWTPDEDFSILFEALGLYESRCESLNPSLPDLICIITGKGPLKDYYQQLIGKQQWTRVKVIMPWLEPEDYPLMLGSADLGVCLHTSSSGVDLPMKVVDMFGCGLPVAAKNFQALPELVKDNINGVLFENSDELADRIIQWFKDFPLDSYERRRRPFVKDIERFRALRWPDHWRAIALPVLREIVI